MQKACKVVNNQIKFKIYTSIVLRKKETTLFILKNFNGTGTLFKTRLEFVYQIELYVLASRSKDAFMHYDLHSVSSTFHVVKK